MATILIEIIVYAARAYSFLLVLYALLSWLPGAYQSGLGRLLSRVCEPYIAIFDRLNLNFAGMNFSVLIGMIVLNLVTSGLVKLLLNLGIY